MDRRQRTLLKRKRVKRAFKFAGWQGAAMTDPAPSAQEWLKFLQDD